MRGFGVPALCMAEMEARPGPDVSTGPLCRGPNVAVPRYIRSTVPSHQTMIQSVGDSLSTPTMTSLIGQSWQAEFIQIGVVTSSSGHVYYNTNPEPNPDTFYI